MMADDEKSKYIHLWYKELIGGTNPTEYGATHYEEGFAEACRLKWSNNKHQNADESEIIEEVQQRLHNE